MAATVFEAREAENRWRRPFSRLARLKTDGGDRFRAAAGAGGGRRFLTAPEIPARTRSRVAVNPSQTRSRMADGRRTSNFTGRELPAVAPRYRRVSGRMLTAAIAGAGAVVLAAMHVARHGTVDDRIIAGSLCVLALLGVVAVPIARQRPLRNPRRVLLGWVSAVDRSLADRLGRALALADAPPPGTSVALANLHAERALSALPLDSIDEQRATTARRRGRRPEPRVRAWRPAVYR